MNFSWRLQRQIVIFTIYFLIVTIPTLHVISNLIAKNPTCFDGIKNQDETQVDCNGVCSLKCEGTYKDIKVNFSRGLYVAPNVYDIFALLDNFNDKIDFPVIPYNVSFYNAEGKLLGIASGTTSVLAKTRGVVYLPSLHMLQDPKTIEFNIGEHKALKSVNPDSKILLNVQNWQAQRGANDTLQVVGELSNPYNESISNVDIYALLYNDTKSIYAVSKTKVRNIIGREKQAVTFTWGNIKSPQNVEFIVVQNN